MKRTPLLRRNRPHRPWTRAEEDKVDPAEAEYVFNRDRICLQSRVDPEHQCRTNFGRLHANDDRRFLRIAHVKEHATMGRRAPSDRKHMVAECDDANMNWSSSHRDIERSYLEMIEGRGKA